MNFGVVIKKARDLDESLFWSMYDQKDWIDNNYLTKNEDYHYCVARETMKLIHDARKCGVPFFIDLKRKEGDQDIINIFDIKTGKEAEWFNLFEEIKRPVKLCNRKELITHLDDKTFLKSKEKGFSYKGVNSFINATCHDYGKWCYPLEDRGIDINEFTANPLNYKEAIVDMLPPCEEFLISPIVDFDFNKEIRVIYCGDQVSSIASKHDYKNELSTGIEDYANNFAKKYGDKVPYLIWSVDFHPIKEGFDIVEAHLHCDFLGKFYGNQDFIKLFYVLRKILLTDKKWLVNCG